MGTSKYAKKFVIVNFTHLVEKKRGRETRKERERKSGRFKTAGQMFKALRKVVGALTSAKIYQHTPFE